MAGWILPKPGQMAPRGHAVHRTWPTMPLKKPGSQTIGELKPSLGQKAPAGQANLTPNGQ